MVKESGMSSDTQVESAPSISSVIVSVARGRDVLATLAAAWSSSAAQLELRQTHECAGPSQSLQPADRATTVPAE